MTIIYRVKGRYGGRSVSGLTIYWLVRRKRPAIKYYIYEGLIDRETNELDLYKYRCQEEYAKPYDTAEEAKAAAKVAEPEDFGTFLTVIGLPAAMTAPSSFLAKP